MHDMTSLVIDDAQADGSYAVVLTDWPCGGTSAVQNACLVVDDTPGVWHHAVVVIGKGMVAGPGGPKAVAHHLHTLVAIILQLLADVIGCQGGQGTTQGMP